MTSRDKKEITLFLKETYGVPLSFIAKKHKISLFKIYNYVKGIQRNPQVEKIFLEIYDVPQKLITKTFNINKKKK